MATEGHRTVEDYSAYIQSSAWQAKRRAYFESKMPQDCYVCGAEPHSGMHLHHRTYKNLGNERLMDLVPVCEDCHERIHRVYRENPRMGLWKATRRARLSRRQRNPGTKSLARQ